MARGDAHGTDPTVPERCRCYAELLSTSVLLLLRLLLLLLLLLLLQRRKDICKRGPRASA